MEDTTAPNQPFSPQPDQQPSDPYQAAQPAQPAGTSPDNLYANPTDPAMPQPGMVNQPQVPESAPPAPPSSNDEPAFISDDMVPIDTGKKKKLFLIIAIVLALLLILGAAFYLFKDKLFAGNSNQPVTLTYWGLWQSPEEMAPLIQEYQQQHQNITIKYEQRPIANHYTTISSRLKSNSPTSPVPDIVRLHDSWVPVLNDYLSPLPERVMSHQEYEDNQYPVTKDTLFINDNYYGLPLSIDGLALVYNQELFNQANIETVPTTWDEVRDVAAKLTQVDDKGRITTAGIAMGGSSNIDNFSEITSLLFAQNGVNITNQDGQVSFDKSFSDDGRNKGAEALAFYTLFTTTEKSWDDGMEPSVLALSKGKVGMILAPSWQVLSLIEQNPQLQIKVAPAPQLTTDSNVGYASYWVESVPRASQHQVEAWQFITWLNQPEQQSKLYQQALQYRALAQPPANPKSANLVSNDALLEPYIIQANGYRASIIADRTGADQLNGAINQALGKAIATTRSAGSSRDNAAASALSVAADEVSNILLQQRQ